MSAGRKRKLTPEQHRELAARHLLYLRLRIEAAKHSPYRLARDYGINASTLRDYLARRVA